jgi:putative ABC transport system permease protein
LLSLAGGGFGLFLAWASLGPLLKLSAGSVPAAFSVSLDRSVLLFTLGVSILVGLVFGIVPALRTAQIDLRETLNEGSRGSTSGPGQHRLRGVLVAAEIAMALLLLVGAGLLLKSFERLQDVPPGFRPDHLLIADLPLSQTAYARPEQRFEFYDRTVEHARSLPGIRSAAATTFLPVSGGGGLIHFNITGRPPKSPHDFTAAGFRAISAGYFETLAVPLLQGRLFAPGDIDRAPAVVLINTTMARTYFPNENPLGKRLQLGATPESQIPTMEIVGVVGDVLQGLGDEAKAEMYVPYRQVDALLPIFQMSVVLRTSMEPLTATSALRSAIGEIDPNQPLVNVRSMDQNIQTSVAQPRFRTWLIGTFAALALVLAAVGVYGVMSYSVTQRTGEIGIRVTMGAQPSDIVRIIVGEGLRLALLGVAVGIVGALLLSRLLRTFVFGVSTSDPATFAGVAIVLTLVGAAASYFPARRATRVDPLVALRYE